MISQLILILFHSLFLLSQSYQYKGVNCISKRDESPDFRHNFIACKYTQKLNTRLSARPRRIDFGDSLTSSLAQELMKHQLLTHEDEIELSKQYRISWKIRNGLKAIQFDENIHSDMGELISQSLGISQEKLCHIIDGGENAKKMLVRANMRLVLHIAGFYKFRGVAFADLVQEGTFGLMKAVDKYDPDRGFRFSTYASWWIKQSVSRAIAEKSRIVRLPVHIHDLMVGISNAEKQFSATHARKPTSSELANRMALPLQKVELLIKCQRDVGSIDTPLYQNSIKQNDKAVLKDRIASPCEQPASINDFMYMRSEIRRVMYGLTDREASVVEMRFGMYDGTPRTLEEIGKHFSVTRERIRQIEARALSKLRSSAKVMEFKDVFQGHSATHTSSVV